jgi:hypothetical protein
MDKYISNDPLPFFFKELKKVSDNQRSLVIITHGFIELLVNTIIDAQCKHGKKKITSNRRDYSHSVKLVLLSELNILDDRLYKLLDWFRKLRNRAAHEPFFELTPADLDYTNKSMNRFIPDHPTIDAKALKKFCELLVDTIWNNNIDELVPVFTPSLAKKND